MSKPVHDYHQQVYLWVSIALLLPVLLWPLFLIFGFTPAFGISIEQNWVIAASCLLMAATVADSILSYRQQLLHAVISAIWIMVISSVITLVIRNEAMTWLLAVLFFLRSLHTMLPLWKHQTNESVAWWQWIAWWRDSTASFAIFLWLYAWPK